MQTFSTAEAIAHLEERAIYHFFVGASQAIKTDNS